MKIKQFLVNNKQAAVSSLVAMVAFGVVSGASAAGETPTVGIETGAIVAGFTGAVNWVLATMAQLLPIGLGVFATVWGIRKAMRFFKATTN